MKLAQVSHDGLAQPANAVVLAVGVKVGAKVRTDGQLQVVCCLQRRPAQRAFGGNVHDVGSVHGPQLHQRTFGGHAHAQIGVAGYGQAAHQHLVETHAAIAGLLFVLSWAYQLHVVVAVVQTFHHFGNRHGHAIDFRWVGFCDHRDSQRPMHGRVVVHQDAGRCG